VILDSIDDDSSTLGQGTFNCPLEIRVILLNDS
jgi:hypothetical protein